MSAYNNSLRDAVIWDLPTRVFHWSLVISFTTAWITAENDLFLYHHVFAGYAFVGLLIFRLIWGVIGSQYAKFRSFAYDWPSATSYVKALLTGKAARHIGHNPAGSYAIFAMIIMGFLVALSGLIVLGGEEGHGPLKGLISHELGMMSKELHEGTASFMLLIVILHLGGVIVESFYHKENLIWSMFSGRKTTPQSETDVNVSSLVAVLMLGVIFASASYYFYDYITQTTERPFLAFTSDPLPDNQAWQDACGECHLAYHPTLLPARAWQRILNEQDTHFDEDLSLDEAVIVEIRQFLTANASEQGLTEAAHKMINSIPADSAPLRITETKYWRKKHSDIDDKFWNSDLVGSKANCEACHRDAKQGWFEDSNMQLPKLQP